MNATPARLVDRLHDAINRHDLEAFLSCFAADYKSEQPAHPNRGFGGREQVRQNWAAIFAAVPDLRANRLRTAQQEDTSCSEWHWHGHRQDGTTLDMRGVILLGEQDGQIIWG